MFRLPRLSSNAALVDDKGQPTVTFQQWWQTVVQRVELAIQTIVDLTGIQDQFEQALAQAQQATAAAQAAAGEAQAAADAAQAQTDATKREAALQGSYIEPASVLSATPTAITIAAHTRMYADGSSVAVNGGTVPATASNDIDYVSYDDPTRTGGSVAYQVSTAAPVQTGDTHVVGAVAIPATGTVGGGEGPQRPGYVRPLQQQQLPDQ